MDEQPKDGYLDHIVAIFQKHNHPLIVIEELGFRWMGIKCAGMGDLDLLIRDSEIEAIRKTLISSGLFEHVEQDPEKRLYDIPKQVPRFRDISPHPKYQIEYINLWSESVYALPINETELVPVLDISPPTAFVVENRYAAYIPELSDYTFDGIKAAGFKTVPKYRFSSDPRARVYVPLIPRVCEALIHQRRTMNSERAAYHLSNFVRYLYLERPAQRELIVGMLEPSLREDMDQKIASFRRKPKVVINKDGAIETRPG